MITNIPAPRVSLIDQRTGLMSREWYRFFVNLFTLTGAGTSDVTITDLAVAPSFQAETLQSRLAELEAKYVSVSNQDVSPVAIPNDLQFDPLALFSPAQVSDVFSISGLGAGVSTFLQTPSSANLAATLTDETGSGAAVFGTSPSIATPTFTGAVTEAPRAASWQFADWNPSDVAGTESPPTDTPTASLTATNYMTMASSSGTLTFTFTKAGNYLVSFAGYITSAGTAYTSFYVRLILGGTATRYLTPTSLYNQAIDADSGKSVPFGITILISATANQTVTVRPLVAVTSGSAASNFTMSAAAMAVYTGT